MAHIARGAKSAGGTSFTTGTIIASEANTDFDTSYNLVNGNLDNANISAAAAIDPLKIDNLASQTSTDDPAAGPATNLAEEIQQLRFQINQIIGGSSWIVDPPTTFSTGDVKLTFKTTADSGWVLMNDGSIGSAASGATTRANADTETLYTLLWNNVINAWAPVSTGRGASAAADFAANKTLTLPRALGRALGIYGSGAGLTARVLGEYLGAETHTLIEAEMPAHTHTVPVGGAGGSIPNSATTGLASTYNTGSTGGGGAHANMQPTAFLNVMIRL